MNKIAIASVAITALTFFAANAAEPPALTIYNDGFGVVRETLQLDLKQGENQVRFADATAHVEPDSVILRDAAGRRRLLILEQNYRNDPVSQDLLLSLFEGKQIEFVIPAQGGQAERIVQGKIVRSGYVPHVEAWNRYGPQYAMRQTAMISGVTATQPVIELDGKLRFGLPGTPLFPALGDDTILKPAFEWLLRSEEAGPLTAELAYVTGGMSWNADYNVVAAQQGDDLDVVGWITMDNQTGKGFREAKIKLIAGDVNKITPAQAPGYMAGRARMEMAADAGPPVTEKSFDEYHMYSLQRQTTLRDRETKQVEFLRGMNVPSERLYVYEGAWIDNPQYAYWDVTARRENPEYGNTSNRKVWVMRQFRNSQESGLGMPLPAGRVRFYREDDDGRLEFVGENTIDHTPKDELVRIYTGNAFDIVGERTRKNFVVNSNERWAEESFEIAVRNHKKDAIEVRVVERLYRWSSWNIREKAQDFEKLDAQKIEFRVNVPADGEKKVAYTVRYSW